jgi:hypothetical protein
MLGIINFILIVIIIIALITNIYMLFKLRDNVKQSLSSLSTDVSLSSVIARQAMLKSEAVQPTTNTPQSISLTVPSTYVNI